ncbi:MAG: LacI family DNA-binding transcriptional regulator [Marvinbryantia sp.]|jgi:LacI family transcriptional regulator
MASTIRDVAARAGLSVATVSKYINGKTVKESTRLAIEEAIKELDFHPNNIAKGLCNAKSFSVAILLPMLDSTFCTSMISSIESTQRLIDLGHKDIGILLPSSALITAFMKMFCPINFPLSSIT